MTTAVSTLEAKHPRIEEIQPLSWEIMTIPKQLCQVYALRLPDHWRFAIRGLDKVDRVPPVIALYTVLQALAPEIIYFFPGTFSSYSERRPDYWLVAEAVEGELDPERLMWAIQGWLNTCYPIGVVRVMTKELKSSDLIWEPLNLQAAKAEVVAGALPGLVARWLLRTGFEFELSDGQGHTASWPVRLAPSRGPESDLITWPPVKEPLGELEHSYSYYLKFRLGSIPHTDTFHLLCQPGIRRWVNQPLVRINGNGKKPYINLVWGREKSVFVARESASWLTQQSAETSLIRLTLRRYYDVHWTGRLPDVLASLAPHESIPDALHLLAHPADFQPNILVIHDNFMSERHPVGLGIEAADRWEVFNQLCKALPAEVKPTQIWRKVGGFIRAKPSFASQERTQVGIEPRLNGVRRMRAPALVEICALDADRWKSVLLEELGLPTETPDGEVVTVMAENGATTVFRIIKRALGPELLAELPRKATDSDEAQHAAERHRVRFIEKTLGKTLDNAGFLVEMPNYREMYHRDSREARRDPKRAVRWGLARSGRVSQFIQPEDCSPGDYEQRVRNGVRDLLRQMDFHLNPLYTGFRRTSLPGQIDLIGLWQIRLNPRRRGERKVTLPLVIYVPADEHKLEVCLPSDDGPGWYSYRKSLMTVPDFSGGYSNRESIRTFFARAIQKMTLSMPTLMLLSEQNLRDVWPELKDGQTRIGNLTLSGVLPTDDANVRIARLRFSRDGIVPLVCPTHTFGRFTGLYHCERFSQVFYSIQKRPVSAKRPTALRQRDAWRRLSWNPSTVEIAMFNLQPRDVAEEWAWVVHRLREESSHTSNSTLLPEPLHAANKVREYVMRIADD